MSAATFVLVGVVGVLLAGAAMQVWMGFQAKAAKGRDASHLTAAGAETSLVWFHSPTCGPCRAMEPTIHELAKSHPVRIVDVSKDPETAMAMSVMATPTTLVVKEGKVVDVMLGAVPRGRLEAAFTQ
ncbi:MAG: thioredoxin family protein [Alphaproteobacteria bacterium]|nr:thioredoxin family protein [Alphaproteobacteria bacterium]MCB9688143.1 thioredoxin family protein [Alphaproteobacteria bacterium]